MPINPKVAQKYFGAHWGTLSWKTKVKATIALVGNAHKMLKLYGVEVWSAATQSKKRKIPATPVINNSEKSNQRLRVLCL